jgi:hypothetical protein
MTFLEMAAHRRALSRPIVHEAFTELVATAFLLIPWSVRGSWPRSFAAEMSVFRRWPMQLLLAAHSWR